MNLLSLADGLKLLSLADAASRGVAEVGGKALGLARLASLGLPVPDALVLLAVDEHAISEAEAAALWSQASCLGVPVAVRSSAADEDVAERSGAGQYESVMGVRDPAGLAAAVLRCRAAAHGSRIALVLQREIASDRAGVAFSADPVSGSREVVVIEAVFGHGEGIVSGQLAPDRYLVNRASGEVRARIADKAAVADGRGGFTALPRERRLSRVLRDHEVREVAALVSRAEDGFGMPVDVEFCFSGARLWLVQCRPITTLHAPA